MPRRLESLDDNNAYERLRLRHDYDPAPDTDAARFIVRDRTDREPGVVVILADTDKDYRAYHLGHAEIEMVVTALTERPRPAD